MTTPTLGTILYGNCAVVPGFDAATTGVGNFAVASRALIGSVTAADNYTGGVAALKVLGGVSIEKNLMIADNLQAQGDGLIEGTFDVTGSSTFRGDVTFNSVTETEGPFGPAAFSVRGGAGIGKHIDVGFGGRFNQTPFAYAPADGQFLLVGASLFTDDATAAGATVPTWSAARIEAPALATANGAVTYGDASSFSIFGAPAGTGDAAITESYAVRVHSGRFYTSDTTDSTDVGIGSIITDGGLSVRGATYQNGVLHVVNETDSVDGDGGAIVVSGAVNIAKELKLGTGIQSNLNQPIRTLAGATDLNNFIFQNDRGLDVASVGIGNSASENADYLGNYFVQAANSIILNGGNNAAGHQVTVTPEGRVLFHGPGADGTLRISPLAAGDEASIAFSTTDAYDAASATPGDYWLAGKNAFAEGSQNFAIGTNVFGTVIRFGADGVTHLPYVLDSATPTDGSLTLAGGAGIGKHANIGFGLQVNQTAFAFAPQQGQFLLVGDSVYTDDATAGGATVAQWSAASIEASALTAANGGVTYTDASALRIEGIPAATGGLALTESYAVRINTGRFYSSDTTDSTAVGIGSIITDGGLSVRGATYQNGVLHVVNTTDSVAGAGGAIVVSGAVNIAKELKLGTGIQSNLNEPIRTLAAATEYNNFLLQDDLGANIVNFGIGNSASANADYLGNYYVQAANSIILNGGDDATGHQVTVTPEGRVLFHGPGADGTLRISPLAAGAEASIGFYTDDGYNAASATIGDYWIAGKNAWAVGTQNFSIGTNGTGNVLQLDADGVVRIPLTRNSTGPTDGALVVSGGAGFVHDVSIGGNFRVVAGTSDFAGVVTITDPTDSVNDSGVGALVVHGGIATQSSMTVAEDLYVKGATTLTGLITGETDLQINRDANISRNLTVGGAVNIVGDTVITGLLTIGTGDAQQINTVGLTIEDNFLLLNSAPAGVADAGSGIKRFQTANDAAAGDVVRDQPLLTGTAAAGATATTIVLGPEASTTDDAYTGNWILITDGTGANQVRRIATYAGATRTATLVTTADQDANGYAIIEGMDWTTVPDAASRYSLYNTQYINTYWSEADQEYVFGASGVDPTSVTHVDRDDTITVHVGDLIVDRTARVDTIVEKNPDSGVDVETVHFQDGHVTGVLSVNGSLPIRMDPVYLIDNAPSNPQIPGSTNYGSYMVLVDDASHNGAAATFFLSGTTGRGGSVTRLSSVTGPNEETLGITWMTGDVPRLVFVDMPVGGTGATITYNVKVISTLAVA